MANVTIGTDRQQADQKRRAPQVLKGFRDYAPQKMLLRLEIIRRFREVFERHGFEPLDTPAIEYLEVLTGKAGENEKLMYQFLDHGDREVGLRYDLTVPLARFVAMHQSEIVLPFKRYHIAPVWRAEKPQRGRFREFWQCDADIVGSPSMIADAEVVSIAGEALDAVGLTNYQIHISHRALLRSIARASGVSDELSGTVYRVVDKLDKIGPDGVLSEMREGGIDEQAAQRVLASTTLTGSPAEVITQLRGELAEDEQAVTALDELDELFACLPPLGLPSDRVVLDLSLARGLDYYTGPVFEAIVTEPRIGSVAGGGRYEELIGQFLGRNISATGISMGLERIIEVVNEFETLSQRRSVADVFVVVAVETVQDAARIATTLRQQGFNVELGSHMKRSRGEQLKMADRKSIPFAVIVRSGDEDELVTTLKDLRSGEEYHTPEIGLAERLEALALEQG
jgi:histidyl-tRNA synthetase